MTDLTTERDAVASLMRRNDAEAIWSALAEDGWLEALPESAEEWSTAEIARLVVELAAGAEADISVGAYFAAAATLTEAGELPDDATGFAVAVDLIETAEGSWRGRLWGDERADVIVASLPGGIVATVASADVETTREPILLLAGAHVRSVDIPKGAVHPVAGGSAIGARHDARVGFFLAVEAVVTAQLATQRTLEHLQVRRQFGSPLSTQQVLQHRLVDMRLAAMVGSALLDEATEGWETGDGVTASLQAAFNAGRDSVWVAENAIQLHGGVGFTAELRLGRALSRAQRVRTLLGGVAKSARAVVNTTDHAAIPGLVDWSVSFDPEQR
ncbi:MAG: hypothetical protein JWQ19_2076 [Subtercola sp.]|nr:hypothetical protein [Subtercola sp.]